MQQLKKQALERLVDVNAAGDFLGCSGWTVRALISSGKLPSVPVGRLVRVDLRDLEAYVARNKASNTVS